ncbi:MAG: chitobiase/beta-hexosaminidase C-terminal domain-containing protein [Coriobacteriia bacterium]|nr:chitobiase/beta-hexosaminidase C-terminal domain-containing protein [Coriobacteriia bacterium]
MKKKSILILLALCLLLTVGCSSPNTEEATESPEVSEPVVTEEFIPGLVEPDPVGDDIVLVIFGDGVEAQTNWTLADLQALDEGLVDATFSTTNNWPSFATMAGIGVSLPYLLEKAGILPDAQSLAFSAPDGYQALATREQVFDTRYTYTEHTAEQSSGSQPVDAIIAWAWGNDEAKPEAIRPLFGQLGPRDVNTASSVKDLYRIEVSVLSLNPWATPEGSIPSGSTVSAGTELELSHPQMDNTRLYYTLDGSAPNYESEVYNRSATYYQPELIEPIILNESVTVRVFAGGLGRPDSEITTLEYIVE